MKHEARIFRSHIIAHDKFGNHIDISISELQTRSDVVRLLSLLGFEVPANSIYTWKKARNFPIDNQDLLYGIGVRLGEFKYEPVIFCERKK